MAIIILRYKTRKTPNGQSRMTSVVSCDNVTHEGNRIRVIDYDSLLRTNTAQTCKDCAKKGYNQTPEHVEKCRLARTGIRKSSEARQRMSESRKGCKFTEEHRQALRKAHLGVPLSPTHAANLKAAMPKRERHHNWNPNLTDKERTEGRNNPLLDPWRATVLKRDKYKCQISGRNYKLRAHHIDGWNIFKDKGLDLDNGITVNEEIHKLFHSTFGYGDNTKAQWDEFANWFQGNDTSYIEIDC